MIDIIIRYYFYDVRLIIYWNLTSSKYTFKKDSVSH